MLIVCVAKIKIIAKYEHNEKRKLIILMNFNSLEDIKHFLSVPFFSCYLQKKKIIIKIIFFRKFLSKLFFCIFSYFQLFNSVTILVEINKIKVKYVIKHRLIAKKKNIYIIIFILSLVVTSIIE